MKNFSLLIVAVICCLMFINCGGSKQIISENPNVTKRTEKPQEPCIVLQQQKPEIRAYGNGIGTDDSWAVQEAENAARNQYQRMIESMVESGSDAYQGKYGRMSSNGKSSAQAQDFGGKVGQARSSIAKGIVRKLAIIKTSLYQREDGLTEAYVCLEYRDGVNDLCDKVASQVNQLITDDERMKINFEQEEFKKIMMQKFEDYKKEKGQ